MREEIKGIPANWVDIIFRLLNEKVVLEVKKQSSLDNLLEYCDKLGYNVTATYIKDNKYELEMH